jgi:PKD repeat protein
MKKITLLTVLLCFVVYALPAHADPQPKDVNVTNDSSNAVHVVDYTNRLIATAASNKSIGYYPLGVDFSSSIVGGTGPIAINWDFGDGGSDINPNPHYNYFSPGSFLVTLTAVDSLGLTAVSTLTIQVNVNRPPFARLVADRVVGVAPLEVKFDASDSFDPYGDHIFFDLRPDDGPVSTSSPFFTHVYTSGGTYYPNVTVEDANGMDDTESVQITVEADSLPVLTTSIPISVAVGTVASFSAYSFGGNSPWVYHWEFGDGSTSKMYNTSHTYVHPGDYMVTVTVTDADGDVDSASEVITVSE